MVDFALAGVLRGSMPVGRIAKAWQKLALSKKRQTEGVCWLQWGSDSPKDQYEPSCAALALNAPMVYVMFEEFKNLDTPVIQPMITLALWFI